MRGAHPAVDVPVRPPFPFIVGCGRSGSTLLRLMLMAGGELAIPPESRFIQRLAHLAADDPFDVDRFVDEIETDPHFEFHRWHLDRDVVREAVRADPPVDFVEAVRRVFGCFAASRGALRYGDKTTDYADYVGDLATLFPEARFVHLVRDGRDVAPAFVSASFGPQTLSAAGRYWRHRVARTRELGLPLGPGRYLEVRYEDLVARPEETLRRVCDHIEISFDPEMLRPERHPDPMHDVINPQDFVSLIGRPVTPGLRDWRRDLTSREVAVLEGLIGDQLDASGYERRHRRIPLTARLQAGRDLGGRWIRRRVRRRLRRMRRALTGS